MTVKRHISPLPAAPAPNVELSAPLAKDHAPGTATNLNNVILAAPLTKAHATGVAVADPQPLITAAKATELRTLLADAKTKADAGNTAAAIAALQAFNAAAAASRPLAERRRGADRPAAGHAGRHGRHRRHGRGGRGGRPGDPRVLQPDRRSRANPREVQDPRQRPRGWLPPPVDRRLRVRCSSSSAPPTASTSRSGTRTSTAARAASRRPASRCPPSPFLDYNALKQYKTIVFNSTVGINGTRRPQRGRVRQPAAVRPRGRRRRSPSTAASTRCRTCRGSWTSSAPASPTTAATRAAS